MNSREFHNGQNSGERVLDGVRYVWSILDNAWVTLDYWRWVNGVSGATVPDVRESISRGGKKCPQ